MPPVKPSPSHLPFAPFMQGTHLNTVSSLEDDSVNWVYVPAKDDLPTYYVYTAPIMKSPRDNCEYRVIRLENRLEAVLVHDKERSDPVMNLSVATGYSHDADGMPGLARLCHKALVSEINGDYDRESGHYGTVLYDDQRDSQNTHFLFFADPIPSSVALEKFAATLQNPQFVAEHLGYDIDALDFYHSEHLKDDDWRVDSLKEKLLNREYQSEAFGCMDKEALIQRYGSKGTTWAPQITGSNSESDKANEIAELNEIRHKLIGWWEKEYSASRMKLVLISKESLDDLTLAVVKLFSQISDRGEGPTQFPKQSYGKEGLGEIVYVKTIEDTYTATITLPIRWQAPLWRVKPCNFVAYFLQHEGQGSLYSYLKKKGWVSNEILAGGKEVARERSAFEIKIRLTAKGFKHYREVIMTCFYYINLLRESEPMVWVQKEIMRIDELAFLFGRKPGVVDLVQDVPRTITNRMHLPVPRALVLANPTVEWNGRLIQEMLDGLVVENSLIMVAARDHTAIGKSGPWLSEPRHGAQYHAGNLNDDLIFVAKMPNDITELALPQPNRLIAENVDVQKANVPHPKKRPSLIKRTPLTELWYKKDDQFWVPHVNVIIHAWSPFAGATARACVMTRIFSYLVNEQLAELTYDAHRASSWYRIHGDDFGLFFSFEGYADKMQLLVRLVLEKVQQAVIKKEELDMIVQKEKTRLTESFSEPPFVFRILDEKFSYLLEERFITEEKIKALEEISVKGLVEHGTRLLSQSKYTILANGNISKEDAFEFASIVEDVLGSQHAPGDRITQHRTRILPRPCNYVWEQTNPDVNDIFSGIIHYCHIGINLDQRTSVIVFLLRRILFHHSFDDEIVTGDHIMKVHYIDPRGLRIDVRTRADPTFFELRIETWLRQMVEKLTHMDEDEFEKHKVDIVNLWTDEIKFEELANETDEFSRSILSGYYNFYHLEDDAKVLQSVTKEEVVNLYKTFIDPDSPTRSKLSIYARSQAAELDIRAQNAFIKALRKANIASNEDDNKLVWENEFGPAVRQARAEWENKLRVQLEGDEDVATLLEEFDQIAEKYHVHVEGPVELGSNVVFIDNVDKFKKGLALSEYPRPVEEFEVE